MQLTQKCVCEYQMLQKRSTLYGLPKRTSGIEMYCTSETYFESMGGLPKLKSEGALAGGVGVHNTSEFWEGVFYTPEILQGYKHCLNNAPP